MLSQINQADLVIRDPTTGAYELAAVAEAGEWDHPRALFHLQEKVNGYLSYALDGQMHTEHPDSVGKPVTIALCSVDPYPGRVLATIERMRPIINGAGLHLEVKRVHLDQAA